MYSCSEWWQMVRNRNQREDVVKEDIMFWWGFQWIWKHVGIRKMFRVRLLLKKGWRQLTHLVKVIVKSRYLLASLRLIVENWYKKFEFQAKPQIEIVKLSNINRINYVVSQNVQNVNWIIKLRSYSEAFGYWKNHHQYPHHFTDPRVISARALIDWWSDDVVLCRK